VAGGALDGGLLAPADAGYANGVQLSWGGDAATAVAAGAMEGSDIDNGWGVVTLLPPAAEGGPVRLFINLAREGGAPPPAPAIPVGRILNGGVSLETLVRQGQSLRVQRAYPAS